MRSLLLLALLIFLSGCPGFPAKSAERVAQCKVLYDRCVDVSPTMADYVKCRKQVDDICLPSPEMKP